MTRAIFFVFTLPLLFMAAQIGLETLLPHDVLARLHSENGPHELLQTLIMAAAFAVAAATLIRMDRRRNRGLSLWIGLAAVCCFYVAGEEISWGQHVLDWTTPEFWSAVNDQNETNFHNTSSWLDQKPRLLLESGVFVGGIVMPLLMRFRPGLLPARFAAIYPPPSLWLVATLALGVKLAEAIAGAAEIILFERASEVVELYIYYFVLVYLLALRQCAIPGAAGS